MVYINLVCMLKCLAIRTFVRVLNTAICKSIIIVVGKRCRSISYSMLSRLHNCNDIILKYGGSVLGFFC